MRWIALALALAALLGVLGCGGNSGVMTDTLTARYPGNRALEITPNTTFFDRPEKQGPGQYFMVSVDIKAVGFTRELDVRNLVVKHVRLILKDGTVCEPRRAQLQRKVLRPGKEARDYWVVFDQPKGDPGSWGTPLLRWGSGDQALTWNTFAYPSDFEISD